MGRALRRFADNLVYRGASNIQPQTAIQTHYPAPGSPGAYDRLSERFSLDTNQVRVGGTRLLLPELADPEAYMMDRLELSQGRVQGDQLPYWTKLWPAALVLGGFAAGLGAGEGPLLELGCGLGLPGLAAAKAGRSVVLSDLDPDALEFARAAVELNDLQDRVLVTPLDWSDPDPALGGFTTVLGAEILYHPPLYPKIMGLLDQVLDADGTVFISHQERPFLIGFFHQAKQRYRIRRTCRTMRCEDEQTKVMLYALDKKFN